MLCLPLFIEPKAQNIPLFTTPLYWTPWSMGYPASKAHYPPLESWATSLPPCSITPIHTDQFVEARYGPEQVPVKYLPVVLMKV
jgi:hypothetical protein